MLPNFLYWHLNNFHSRAPATAEVDQDNNMETGLRVEEGEGTNTEAGQVVTVEMQDREVKKLELLGHLQLQVRQ